MTLGTLQLIGCAKVVVTLIVLAAGSLSDLKRRRIPDSYWALLIAGAAPLLIWEMHLRGASDAPVTFLALLMPLSGMLFVLYGYPELKEVLKGRWQDIMFFLVYAAAVVGAVAAFLFGDRKLFSRIALSFVFMAIYFGLYHISLFGARLIHGGADAKCLMALAAVNPAYITGLPFQIGPFYEMLRDVPELGWIMNIHLSVLFNAVAITGLLLIAALPMYNVLKGDLHFPRSFTSFKMKVGDLPGSHVWVLTEEGGKNVKKDPEEKVVMELKKEGLSRVWVTPKIPFILSLTIGFAVQTVIGNLLFLAFILLG